MPIVTRFMAQRVLKPRRMDIQNTIRVVIGAFVVIGGAIFAIIGAMIYRQIKNAASKERQMERGTRAGRKMTFAEPQS